MKAAAPHRTSRAVVRYIEAGTTAACAECGEQVQFRARVKVQQVICNVYEDGRWMRVEHFHRECYDVAGHPHGEPDESQPMRPKMRQTSAAAPAEAVVEVPAADDDTPDVEVEIEIEKTAAAAA